MKRTAQNLSRQFRLLHEIIKNLPLGIAVIEKGVIRFHNPYFSTIFGSGAHNLHNKRLASLISHFQDNSALINKIDEVIQTGDSLSYETNLIPNEGAPLDLAITIITLPARKLKGKAILIINDITQRKRNERILSEIHNIYRKSIANAQGVPYILSFQDNRYQFIGENISEVVGIDADNFTYTDLCRYCLEKVVADPNPPTSDPEEYEKAFRNGTIDNYRMDIHIKNRFGQSRWLSDNAVAIIHPVTKKLYGAMGILQDITFRKELERERDEITSQLRQQKKLESIGFLAAGVAHEINNPLTGMINYAQLIYDRINDETLRTFAQGIIEEGDRVATIVRHLLAFARQEKEEHSPTQIANIIKASLSLIKTILRKNSIELDLQIDPNLPAIHCRGQQIQQVIINLLTNAVAALNEKYPTHHPDKIIQIDVRPIQQNSRSYVQIAIEDHGIGIPAEIIDNIFDPFFTTKRRNEGTGLGLSVSYGIIKEHDGNIYCESEPGVYTRFIIELPAAGS